MARKNTYRSRMLAQCRAAKAGGARMYHLVVHRPKSKTKVYLTYTPVTHKEAVTIRKKSTRPAYVSLEETTRCSVAPSGPVPYRPRRMRRRRGA
jgi:hypothetical protein